MQPSEQSNSGCSCRAPVLDDGSCDGCRRLAVRFGECANCAAILNDSEMLRGDICDPCKFEIRLAWEEGLRS